MELLVVGLLVFAAVTLVYQGFAIVLAYEMVRRDPREPPSPVAARVAVVIAARDESDEIRACLGSVLGSTLRPEQVVVVDGGSSDGTVEAAREFPGVEVLPESPLPAGWVGKNWACHLGAASTTAPFVLFLDADVRLHPQAIASAVAWAEEERADLVSYASRIDMVGFWERVVMPFYTQMTLVYFRAPHVNRATSKAAVANGQFLLVRRSAYQAVGGHAAVAPIVLEDVALARLFRAGGHRMRFAWAPELVRTRMYRDRHEMFEGLLKTSFDTRFSAARQAGFLAGLIGLFLLPLAILPIGLLLGSTLVAAVGAFVAASLFLKHAAFARAVGAPGRYGLLYPLAVGFYVAVVARSLVRGLRGEPTVWKGRLYGPAPSTPLVQRR